MKSKKLIVFISILSVLLVLVILNSTVFTLQYVDINWLTTKNEMKNYKDYDIVDSVSTGGNIFLVKKDTISEKLEKKYYYLRVVGIETKFPNKIVLHCAEREPMYAVDIGDGKYAVLDEVGKVLRIANSSIFADSDLDLGARPIRVKFEGFALSADNFVLGEIVKVDRVANLLNNLSYTLRESNYMPTTSKGVFNNISIVSSGETSEINLQTRNGMLMKLIDAEDYTTDKFLLALERYNTYHKDGVVEGTIEVWYNENIGKIFARYYVE